MILFQILYGRHSYLLNPGRRRILISPSHSWVLLSHCLFLLMDSSLFISVSITFHPWGIVLIDTQHAQTNMNTCNRDWWESLNKWIKVFSTETMWGSFSLIFHLKKQINICNIQIKSSQKLSLRNKEEISLCH